MWNWIIVFIVLLVILIGSYFFLDDMVYIDMLYGMNMYDNVVEFLMCVFYYGIVFFVFFVFMVLILMCGFVLISIG